MSFSTLGFDFIPNVISADTLNVILADVESSLVTHEGGGIRNAEKTFTSVNAFARSRTMFSYAERYLGGGVPCLVRAILLDKSPRNNWLVAWHQDKTVALSSKRELEGWGPWSVKEGVHHV